MLDNIKNRIVVVEKTLLDAMKQMDLQKVKTLFVFDKDVFVSILTIGDIQRAIIQGIALTERILIIVNRDKQYANINDSRDAIVRKMNLMRAEVMPIMDDCGNLVDVWFWNDVFAQESKPDREEINLPVVIMAGGKGTRLKPITNVIPKPLIPVGDKTILEEIMNQFENIGCKKFYMSVNYKSNIMQYYLEHLEHQYDIEFFEETKPLGTIGSVSLLKGRIATPFIVSNCDIIIDQDYRDVYDYHRNNNNDLTIVTAVKNYHIPYGVIETGSDGLMTALKEKPDITYMINTGVYILNPDLIDEIPEGMFFHITNLMEKVKARGGRIGCFPVSEESWKDMGEWPEYLRMIKVL